MAEPTYREIQLSLKQLVFFFMSAVVVAVVIFLLGVSVGRGVGEPQGAMADAGAGSATDTMVMADPPPTEPAPGELTYHDDLQGAAPGGGQVSPPVDDDPVPPDAPPVTPPALPQAPPPPDPDPVMPPEPPPPPPSRTPPASQAQPPAGRAADPPASGDWALQIGAFVSRQNAEGLVAKLEAKGYAAYIARPEGSSSLFAVRVGPFQTRAQADDTSQRLSRDPEGYKPLIIR